ncbi:glycoside hydrolase family 108 protein [Flavobacterium sp. J27]|uniref:glycoside hydrolase family 108 protein n=1 Tax=Flavobacterium sp. J27 TaxID=2060419 RepID=UPI001030D1BB|nr:N-acetylmuramidase [Flavobacterium sp. J27]
MASFNEFLKILQNVEGGYQNHYKDSGNYNSLNQLVGTNWGISAKTYERWIKRVPSEVDMRAMPKATAVQIYRLWYWNVMKGDAFVNQSVADIIIDHGVNAGIGTATKEVQRILNTKFGFSLSVDGTIGNHTINAINKVNQEQLHELYLMERINHYRSIGGVFFDGWLTRLKSFVFKKKV